MKINRGAFVFIFILSIMSLFLSIGIFFTPNILVRFLFQDSKKVNMGITYLSPRVIEQMFGTSNEPANLFDHYDSNLYISGIQKAMKKQNNKNANRTLMEFHDHDKSSKVRTNSIDRQNGRDIIAGNMDYIYSEDGKTIYEVIPVKKKK